MTRTTFYYDPARQGYDTTLWKTLSGTVTTGLYTFADTDGGDVDIDIVFDSFSLAEDVTLTLT